MTNKICDGCETVAHCLKNGCVPKTTKQTQVQSTEETPARSALKLALEALNSFPTKHLTPFISSARTAIREALAEPSEALASGASEESSGTEQPAQQEPVAWLDPWTKNNVTTDYDAYGKRGIPLYTSPPTLSLAQRIVLPDAITDDSESPEYRTGWNECREVMRGMMK